MERGVFDVTLVEADCQPSRQPPAAAILPSVGAILLPAVIGAGFEAAGNSIVQASGKNDQVLAISGLKNGYFYCRSNEGYSTRLQKIKLIAPALSKNPSEAFQMDLELKPSEDGSAFSLIPTLINYPAPVLNRRAYGALIEIGLTAVGKDGFSTVLPIGKVRCGRVGNICRSDEESSQKMLEQVSSQWISFPSRIEQQKESAYNTPITVRAKLTEVSSYDQFLAFWGGLFTGNKEQLTKAVVSNLPTITAEDRASRYSEFETNLAVAKADYQAAKAIYEKTVPSDPDCKKQFDAWKALITAAAKARIEDQRINNPPECNL